MRKDDRCLKTTNEATTQAAERIFHTNDSIPEFDEAYDKFKHMYPKYGNTCKVDTVDELRIDEYGHLVSLKLCNIFLIKY